MGIARKWVFPILRLVLILIIAVALVKLSFFPANEAKSDPAQPTGQVVEPAIPVEVGTITNNVTLPGTVTADPAVPVKAVAQGTVHEIFVAAGAAVAAGDKIYTIKIETIPDPVTATDAEGNVAMTQPKPKLSYEKVVAPANGTLSSLGVIKGQAVAVGDATGQIAPPSFSVSGSLSPDQQYRLITQPSEASVAITKGPAPFVCTGLTVTTPLAGAGEDAGSTGGAETQGGAGGAGGAGNGSAGSAAGASVTTVHCAVPPEVKVFPGLAATITIAAGTAENVLVVPTTAVKGSAETGVVWFVKKNGKSVERPVTLGMSDGTQVQVLVGLVEGDTINQFVPGKAAPNTDNCMTMPDGGQVCSGAGMAG